MTDSSISTDIVVSIVDGRPRVVIRLPEVLDALSPRDQERVIENAMWQAANAVTTYMDRHRLTGQCAPLVVRAAAA